jgi:hypothetical protein
VDQTVNNFTFNLLVKRHLRLLEAKPALARTFSHCLHPTVVTEAIPIECNLCDILLFTPLSE